MDGSPTITEDDIVGLNQRQIQRVAATARGAAWALFGLAGLLVIAWLWSTARSQGLFGSGDDSGFVFTPDGVDVKTRVDLFANSLISLAFAGLVAGLGMVTWLLSEWATVQVGGSLTGWELGDQIDSTDDDDEWAAPPPPEG